MVREEEKNKLGEQVLKVSVHIPARRRIGNAWFYEQTTDHSRA